MQVYEVGYLILPSLAEEKLSAVVEKIKAVFAHSGGQELDGEAPFLQDLAYTMSKTVGASRYVVNEAYLGWMKFELDPSKALEVKGELEKVDELLRFLLIKAPKESAFTFAKAQALIEEKEAKEREAKAPNEEANGSPMESVVE
jgi:ribosomal protein S6